MRSGLNKLNNLTQRVIVALLGTIVIVLAIVWDPWTYYAVFFAICLLSLLEFYKLSGLEGHVPLKTWGSLTAMLFYTLVFLLVQDLLPARFLILIFPAAAVVFFIKLYKQSDAKPFTSIAYTFLGIVYVAIPFSLLHTIAFLHEAYDYKIVIGILMLTWASDTGGYFAGTSFGRTKLFERVSPMKSWEGFVGGFLFAVGIAIALSVFFPVLPWWKWIGCAVITAIAGTYGDLVESLFKRSIQIKDSGALLPGHGGFLDRFDAMLLSLPFVAAFLKLL